MAIMMGYRRGEIAGLEWPDMDLSIGKITINRSSVVLSEFGIVKGTPKSKTSKRTSYMPPQLIAVLKDYKVWWNNFIMQLGDRYDGNQRLFLQITGKPLYPSTLYEWMRKLEKKYGLPIVSMHSVRGSSISMQKYSGLLSDEEVMKDAGHSDFQVTQDHYIKPFESEQKRIAVAKAKIFTVQGD